MVRHENPESHEVDQQRHYPYVTRSLLRIYESGVLTNVGKIDVEPEYGYTTRINYLDGSYRITYGNDLGLNAGAACDLARDKGHAKFLLRTIGVNCPASKEFLLPWWAEQISSSSSVGKKRDISTIHSAAQYAEEVLGYPVYAKPVHGSKGSDVYKVYESGQLMEVIGILELKRARVAMIEEPIDMPDYRVVILDGDLISAYRRNPLSVEGDGVQTIHELILKKQVEFELADRDTRIDPNDARITQHLSNQGLALNTRLAEGSEVVLAASSNLSMGGTATDVTNDMHPKWAELAAIISSNFNLRLCGVDLACVDITDPNVPYSVLEVNSAPGLDHYAMSGRDQRDLVDRLYARIFNTLPDPR